MLQTGLNPVVACADSLTSIGALSVPGVRDQALWKYNKGKVQHLVILLWVEKRGNEKKPMEMQVIWKHFNVKIFMVSFCGERLTSVHSWQPMHTQYQSQNDPIFCLSSNPLLPAGLGDHFWWLCRTPSTGYEDGWRVTARPADKAEVRHNPPMAQERNVNKKCAACSTFSPKIITTITWTQPNGVCTIYYK